MASDDFLCLLPPDLRAKIQLAYPPCPARPWPTLVPGLVPATPAAQAQCTAACDLLDRMLMLSPARRITAAAVSLSWMSVPQVLCSQSLSVACWVLACGLGCGD